MPHAERSPKHERNERGTGLLLPMHLSWPHHGWFVARCLKICQQEKYKKDCPCKCIYPECQCRPPSMDGSINVQHELLLCLSGVCAYAHLRTSETERQKERGWSRLTFRRAECNTIQSDTVLQALQCRPTQTGNSIARGSGQEGHLLPEIPRMFLSAGPEPSGGRTAWR